MTLPVVPESFRWKREAWGDALACRPLEAHAQHLFTTRQLQLPNSDPRVLKWVAESVDASADRLYRVTQVHGGNVRIVRQAHVTGPAASERPQADAIISNVAGNVLAVQVADCVPLLVVDPIRGAAAAVHAGWRGTVAGVARRTVEALQQEFGVRGADLLIAIGPSIGKCCYEVGPELMDAFRAAGATDAEIHRWFGREDRLGPDDGNGPGSLRLDLWTANRDQLTSAGVLPEHIFGSELCTYTHADIFHSYRMAGPRAGRVIAAIKVPHV